MDSLGFLVSYDTSIFTLALKLSPLQPKNRKLRKCVSEIIAIIFFLLIQSVTQNCDTIRTAGFVIP